MRSRKSSSRKPCLLAGEMDTEGGAGVFEHTGHAEGEFVRDDGALAETLADEIAEVRGLVVESAGGVGLVEFDDAAAGVVDGGALRVPPIGVNEYVAARAAEQRVTTTAEVDAGVE